MKIKPLAAIAALISLPLHAEPIKEEQVDMNSPVSAFSMVGGSLTADGDFDLRMGIANNGHLAILESKQGFDAYQLRYADFSDGDQGLYLNGYVGDTAWSVSAGYIWTTPITDSLSLYPVTHVGYMEYDGPDQTDATSNDAAGLVATVGTYIRYDLGYNWKLGFDPMLTTFDSDLDFTYDLFIAKQIRNHNIRLNLDEDTTRLQYTIAF